MATRQPFPAHLGGGERRRSTSATAKRWFENDRRVKDLVARDGKLGLGLEADRTYLESQ